MIFSLIIPCYNEEKNLPLLLERCITLQHHNFNIEVILVDNGSTDNTQDVLNKLLPNYPNCRSIRVEKNQGYGHGIISGLKEAKGEIIGWTHADLQTDPNDVLMGIKLIQNNTHNVFIKGKRYGRPIADVFFTMGMSIFESILLRTPLWDINAQPTMFSKEFFAKWENPPKDFSLDLYAYYQAKLSNLLIKRFPVKFSERTHGISHWNISWAAKKKFIIRTVEFSLELKSRLKP